jgi:hypothetical protein
MSKIIDYVTEKGFDINIHPRKHLIYVSNKESAIDENHILEFTVELFKNDDKAEEGYNLYTVEIKNTKGNYFLFQNFIEDLKIAAI